MNIINDCMRHASNREEFIALMESEGYKVRWEKSRKNITYTTPSGWQCRDRLDVYKRQSSTFAVSMMMGNRWSSRMRWQRVKPSMSGSITSSTARFKMCIRDRGQQGRPQVHPGHRHFRHGAAR